MAGRDNEITFRIVKSYGTIQKYETGWSKEVNLVSWNEGPAKFDIRDWDPNHEHIPFVEAVRTLNGQELRKSPAHIYEKKDEPRKLLLPRAAASNNKVTKDIRFASWGEAQTAYTYSRVLSMRCRI